jgi:hypothetical protein
VAYFLCPGPERIRTTDNVYVRDVVGSTLVQATNSCGPRGLCPMSVLLGQWYPAFLVCIPPDVIYLQLCTPKVVGLQLNLSKTKLNSMV